MITELDHKDGSVNVKVFRADGQMHRVQIGPFEDFDQRIAVNTEHMREVGFPLLSADEIELLRSVREALHWDARVRKRMAVNAEKIAEEKRVAEENAAKAEAERVKREEENAAADEAKRIADEEKFNAAVAAAVEKLVKKA